jgi:hypothetical protein
MPLLRTRLSVCQHKSLSATELILFSAFGAFSAFSALSALCALQRLFRHRVGLLQPPV